MNRSDTWGVVAITARTLGSPNGTGPGEVVSDKGHVIAESIDRRLRLLKGELIESHALSGEWTLKAAGAAVGFS